MSQWARNNPELYEEGGHEAMADHYTNQADWEVGPVTRAERADERVEMLDAAVKDALAYLMAEDIGAAKIRLRTVIS